MFCNLPVTSMNQINHPFAEQCYVKVHRFLKQTHISKMCVLCVFCVFCVPIVSGMIHYYPVACWDSNFVKLMPNQGISTGVETRIHNDMSFPFFQLFSYLLIIIVGIYTCTMGFFLEENGERSVLLPFNISSNEHI